MAEVVLTKENFEQEVLKSDIPVLVDFWAVWCGPCQMVAPEVAAIAEAYHGKVKVGKVNVDEQMELAQAFHVSSIPTLLFFKDGKLANTMIGYHSKEEIMRMF
ncbi:MAG: thioredoxin [Clostridiales bacterium]|nr:thioredoxin [Clostridiales bacterium]